MSNVHYMESYCQTKVQVGQHVKQVSAVAAPSFHLLTYLGLYEFISVLHVYTANDIVMNKHGNILS